MNWKKKTAVGAAAVAVLYLFAATGLGPIVRMVAEKKLTEALARRTTIGEVRFNPFKMLFTIEKFRVNEKQGEGAFIDIEAISANLELSSIFRLAPVLSELVLTAPKIGIIRTGDNEYNFSDLVKEKPEDKSKSEKDEPAKFYLGNLRINRGEVGFDNRPVGKKHRVTEIELNIPTLSNLPVYVEEFSSPGLSFRFDGTPFELKGRTKPFADSRETEFDIAFKSLDLARYVAYSPAPLGFTLEKALLSSDLKLSYIHAQGKEPNVTLKGTLSLDSVETKEKGGAALISFESLSVEVAPSKLTEKRLDVASVTLVKPKINVRRAKDGTLNLSALKPAQEAGAEKKETEKAAGKKEEAPFNVTVARTGIKEGVVQFADEGLGVPFKTTLSAITLDVEKVELPANSIGRVALSMKTEAGETLSAGAAGIFDPLAMTGDFKLEGIKIPKYSPYYGSSLNFTAENSTLGLSGEFKAEAGNLKTISALAAVLNGLQLKKKTEAGPFFAMNSLAVRGASLDFDKREVFLGTVSVKAPELVAAKEENGALSLENLTAGKTVGEGEKKEEKPWTVTLGELALDGGRTLFVDRSVKPPASFSLTGIKAAASAITTGPGTGKARLELTTGESGELALGGTVSLNPLNGEFQVDAGKISLKPIDPYLGRLVRLSLADADLDLSGKLSFRPKDGGGQLFSYDGDVALNDLKTVLRDTAEDFAGLKSLKLRGLKYDGATGGIDAAELALEGPYVKVELGPDGTANLSRLKVEKASGEVDKKEEPGSGQGKMRLGAVVFKDGLIEFADRGIKPAFLTKLGKLQGKITQMSSDDPLGGELELTGSVDGYAPIAIKGRLSPFTKDLLVDLDIDFKNVEMSPMSPYSGKYLGYKIEKGKLGLALDYVIKGRKLDSMNKVVFDQLTLGDKVDSPDATSIPVRFALALLTDRRGVIDLEVPVSGTLDDPDFSYGRIIWKVIVNILVKAATSPFALLGSLFGGGEELSYAVFDPASADLTAETTSKLDKMAKALSERPTLKLEVAGRADRTRDVETLREAAFEKKLKLAKVSERAKAGLPAVPLAEITLMPEERPKLLEAVYSELKLPQPGKDQKPPAPELMADRIKKTIEISGDELRALSAGRADSVIGYLIKPGGIEPSRLFKVEAGEKDKPAEEKLPGGRVDFVLK